MEKRRAIVGSRVGLHARPASVFVQAAARQKARVTIGKPGGQPVNARSILSVLSLDVHGGEEVVLYGGGASGGRGACSTAGATVPGRRWPNSSRCSRPTTTSRPPLMADQLAGIGVSPGVVCGPEARGAAPPTVPADLPPPPDAAAEADRAEAALEAVADDLDERAASAGGEAAAILEAQALMARDPAIADMVRGRIESGEAAPVAVTAAFEEFRDLLAAAGGYMAERAADLDDLRNRTVARLLGLPMPGIPQPGHPYVL